MPRRKHALPAAAALVCALAFAARGDDPPLGDPSNAAMFDLDTNCGQTIRVRSLDALPLTVREGETITQTAPGASSPEVYYGPAGYPGTVPWTPTEGGTWTLVNSGAGTAVFGVRYSLFASQGSGTAASPLRLVDDDELVDLVSAGTARDGTVFTLEESTSITGLDPATGFGVVALGDGLYRLTTLSGGLLFTDAPAPFRLDTEKPGPDRKAVRKDVVGVAYTGDGWMGGAAASTLTLTAPSGTRTEFARTGDGTVDIMMVEAGIWNVALAQSSGTTLMGTIDVKEPSTFIQIR